jgi:hypothetical protein
LIRGWVGPRASLDAEEKRKIPILRKWCGKVCTGYSWLKIRTGGRLL